MKLTLVRGLPGSGKTTYAKSLGVLHVEADMFCMVDSEYVFSADKHRRNHNLCFFVAETAIKNGCDVVVSNTFTELWEMQRYLDLAMENGAHIEIVRTVGNHVSIHAVPDDVMEKMRNRFRNIPGEKHVSTDGNRLDNAAEQRESE